MTVSVTPKTRTISNGTPNDATPVDASFSELYNNDNTVATAINTMETARIGEIAMFAGTTIPANFLACDGSAYSRATYSALFGVLSTTWGAGDGATTFNVPDMRSRSPIGAGQGTSLSAYTVGQTGGEETHLLMTTEMPSHTHTVTDTGHVHPLYSAFGAAINPGSTVYLGDSDGGGAAGTPSSGAATTGISLAATGGGAAHNTLHPYAAITYAIKYQGQ